RLGGSTVSGDLRALEDHLDRYDAVTGDQVQQMAQQLFESGPVLGVVGPRVPRRRLEALLERWRTASRLDRTPAGCFRPRRHGGAGS
ncbi:MAG TPA: hypothetical protein VFU98_03690, partial [Microlunatus sp.]|nr:hypothetical protein [Microlunatus sp.]